MFPRLAAVIESTPTARCIALPNNVNPRLNPLAGLEGDFSMAGVDSLAWALADGLIHPLTDVDINHVPVALVIPNTGTDGVEVKDDAQAIGLCQGLYFVCPDQSLTGPATTQAPSHPAFAVVRQRWLALDRAGHQKLPYFGLDGQPVTLHITHDWGGGIDRWIKDICEHDQSGHHLVLSACAHRDSPMMGQWLDLCAAGPGQALLHRQYLSEAIADTAVTNQDHNAFIDWVIARFGVDRVMVSSLIGHSLACLSKECATLQILHDFYPASPVLDADPLAYWDDDKGFDLSRLLDDRAKHFLFQNRQPSHWQRIRDKWLAKIKTHQVGLIAPTEHVEQRWQALFNHQLPAIKKIPHGFDCPPAWMDAPPLTIDREQGSPLRLIVVGRLSSGKGLKRLLRIAQHFGDRVHFTVLGAGQDGLNLFGLANVDVILDYDRDTLPQVIAQQGGHAALFLSRVPETWNYVLSELNCLKMPAIAPNNGSFAERITDGVTGILYPPHVDGLIDCIDQLLQDTTLLSSIKPLSKEPSMAQAIERYQAIAPSAHQQSRWVPRPSPNWVTLHRQMMETETLRKQLVQKTAEVAAVDQKVIEQSRWLDRLDRTVKIRSEWAMRTQKELDRVTKKFEKHKAALTEEQDSVFGHVQLLKQHTQQLKEQYQELSREEQVLTEQLKSSQQHNQELESQLTEREHHIAMLQEQYQELSHEKQVLTEQLKSSQQHNQELESQLAEREHHIAMLQKHNETVEGQLAEIFASKSWRLTRPLRVTVRIVTALRQRKAWHPANWIRQSKRFIHAVRIHGWAATIEALQYHQPMEANSSPIVDQATPPNETQPPSPVSLENVTAKDGDVAASVIIPVYNSVRYTAHCLASIADHPPECAFEVVVVNDCSSDSTAEFLNECDGIRVLNNASNVGFIASCNAGAGIAHGDTLVFLNNDTKVTDNWLDALLETFEHWPDAGVVGARLVYPDGRLQEAGGMVFNDASGWNYGRLGPANTAKVSFVSQADYVSGACLAIPNALFQALGGFDTHYAPAYYEDTDLCFKVRAQGRQVLYQPRSTIVHFEGISSGTSESSGTKRYQAINRDKFKARWDETLASHPDPVPGPNAIELIERARHHTCLGHVLIVDAVTPQPDHDSGSMRMVAICDILVAMGYRVSFMPINLAWGGKYSQALQMKGVEVISHPETSSPRQWLQANGALIDWVLGSRYYVLDDIFDHVRAYCDRAKIIFDTVDLHFLREQRKAELNDDAAMHQAASKTQAKELELIEKSDITFVVSEIEKTLLQNHLPGADIRVLSNIHTTEDNIKPFDQRHGILFVGGYQHPPNVDAARWLTEEIMPAVREHLPHVELHLIGSRMPEWLKNKRQPGLKNHGFVEDIEPYLQNCLLSVAPLRYGAGVKGKVNQAMAWGLPVVATACAAEGMHTKHNRDIVLAETTEDFVNEITRIHQDPALWQKLSENGKKNVERHFSCQAAEAVLTQVLANSTGR